jgi:hypothetical protein
MHVILSQKAGRKNPPKPKSQDTAAAAAGDE